MGFSALGRFAQFIGFVYASNCLLEEFGESFFALGWAQYVHFILTLGWMSLQFDIWLMRPRGLVT